MSDGEGNYPEYLVNEIKAQAREIRRLRVLLEQCNRAREEDVEIQQKRIEGLEKEAIHNEGVMVALREGYTKALARIEELKIEVQGLNESLAFFVGGDDG